MVDWNYQLVKAENDNLYGTYVSKGVYTGLFGAFKKGSTISIGLFSLCIAIIIADSVRSELIKGGLGDLGATIPKKTQNPVVTHLTVRRLY